MNDIVLSPELQARARRRVSQLMAMVGYDVSFAFEPRASSCCGEIQTTMVINATPLGNAVSKTEFQRLMRELSRRMGVGLDIGFQGKPYAQN